MLEREHIWHPTSKQVLASHERFKDIPGYPWSDPDAAAAWARMESIVRRHGPLYRVNQHKGCSSNGIAKY